MGNYILKGHVQAITTINILAILFFLSHLVLYPINVMIGLITLRKGALFGMQILFFSLISAYLISTILPFIDHHIVLTIFMLSIPVWIICIVLRHTKSQGMMLFGIALLCSMIIVISHIWIDDINLLWADRFSHFIANSPNSDEYQEILNKITELKLFNSVIMLSFLFNMIIIVLLARYWQSKLFNPNGFQKEFHGLYLPAGGLILVAMGAFMLFMPFGSQELWQYIGRDILIVMIMIYMIQGIAMIHRMVKQYRLTLVPLIIVYVSLFSLFPLMELFISCLGFMGGISRIMKPSSHH